MCIKISHLTKNKRDLIYNIKITEAYTGCHINQG